MPKPMKLMIEVEEIAHGRVFRMLDGCAGVVSITPIGDGPRSPGGGGQKKGGTQSAPCLVLAAMIEAGKVQLGRDALAAVMKSGGKNPTTLPGTLAAMKKAGEIRASGSGKGVTYGITAAGRKRYDTACKIEKE